MSVFDRLWVSEPINRVARWVTLQRRVTAADQPLSIDEMSEIKDRLLRKQRLLKHVLRIKNQSQHTNFRYKWGQGLPQYRTVGVAPRIVTEYLGIGPNISLMCDAINAIRRAELKRSHDAHDAAWDSMTAEQRQAVRAHHHAAKLARLGS